MEAAPGICVEKIGFGDFNFDATPIQAPLHLCLQSLQWNCRFFEYAREVHDAILQLQIGFTTVVGKRKAQLKTFDAWNTYTLFSRLWLQCQIFDFPLGLVAPVARPLQLQIMDLPLW